MRRRPKSLRLVRKARFYLLSYSACHFCSCNYLTGGGGFDLTKLFHNEVIGDLQQTELGDFASRLLEGKKSEVHPGLQRCRDIMADAERFGKAYHCCAYGFYSNAHWQTTTGSDNASFYPLGADGGFVRDWIRLLDAQLEERGEDCTRTSKYHNCNRPFYQAPFCITQDLTSCWRMSPRLMR